ncbi:MAG: NfeD family protein [Actinobacteria bacterium]|uniref:Unannotated protein n=1 Tax=freshwater metagenome TaxID=449393 RepID=A0A6J6RNQ6_9ZZZZ|nr:NfeD family protein [Actinomycetota bacterium]
MDWLSDHAWVPWLAVAILLGTAEMFSLDLVLIMLGVGALVGMVVALADGPAIAQILAAAAAATLTLTLVRPPLVRRLHSGPDLQQGHDKLVGLQAVVLQEITSLQVGRIKLGGEEWTAAPAEPAVTIEPGVTVEVREIRGATAYVVAVPDPS